jgi:hypothetical protein
MAFLVALLLVVAVHLALGLRAWTEVGLVADDRFSVGLAWLLQQGGSWADQLHTVFFRAVPQEISTALYRPFVDLSYRLEQPWFGLDARGYHATNSVLHCSVAMLWFVLVRRLSGSAAAATATALAFVGWPGHSEVTHWISTRMNLLATCFLSSALLAFDVASTTRRPWCRRLLCWSVVPLLGVLAVGSKESAILLLPLAALLGWLRRPGVRVTARATELAVVMLPLFAAVAAWAYLRADVLHTWGAGTDPAWRLDRVGVAACVDWLRLLFVPVHRDHTVIAPLLPEINRYLAPAITALALGTVHALLLVAALVGLRHAALRSACLFGLGLLAIAVPAVSGLKIDLPTLENVRYAYEPALGLAVLLGLGIASLPVRARGPALAVLVAAHALVRLGNREAWLAAGRVHSRLEQDVRAQAAAAPAPIRVFDAPGVRDGAFVYLVENPSYFVGPPFGPLELAGRARVSSDQDWQPALGELAALAAARRPLAHGFVAAWDDGALVPHALDPQWPAQPWPDVTVGYARVGRTRPFAGEPLPVQVLLQNARELTARVVVDGANRGEFALPPSAQPRPHQVWCPLAAAHYGTGAMPAQLVLVRDGVEHTFALGSIDVRAR